jgi:2-amino-4-hydroxy-6-hydroxymethyldihydropteridine diphosphokinase
MPRVGIALGSNLGDRLANLRTASRCLREVAVPGSSFLQASIYQTEPLLCPPGSPHFYNSAIEMSFNGTASELLVATQTIEKKLGRIEAAERNAPRVVDIDLLYFGDEVIDRGNLVIPHPRIGERRFVLEPLAEIRPDLVLPGERQNISEMLSGLDTTTQPLIRTAGFEDELGLGFSRLD